MPRIRTIKPEFYGDEKLAPQTDTVRLLAAGLISYADDCGRMLDSPKQIEAFVWPQHSRFEEVNAGLALLTKLRFIQRGKTAAGQAIIQIRNWEKHQRVDHPNLKAALPPIVANGSRKPREALATDSRLDLRSTIYDLRSTTNERRSGAREALANEPGSRPRKPKSKKHKPATFAELATRDDR